MTKFAAMTCREPKSNLDRRIVVSLDASLRWPVSETNGKVTCQTLFILAAPLFTRAN
jgi:hypothetical protein